MLSVDRSREILGPDAAGLSDDQVATAAEAAWELARLLFDMRPKKPDPEPAAPEPSVR
ncbi:MAG TPA: hypothetical protein VNJ70_18035 [Thermoanaerobaculia bacterium]|nr:hypothetical protein [Thermoanaerobaculia bacterium]